MAASARLGRGRAERSIDIVLPALARGQWSRPTSTKVFPRIGRLRYRETLAKRDLAALVLAAGQGTRIAPLSVRRAKPLLPMGLETTLARAVSKLRAAFVSHVVVNASHRAEEVVEAGRALAVEVVVETDGPRGTAGGLAAARAKLDARRVIVWNGDIVSDLDVRLLIAAFEDGPGDRDRADDDRAVMATLAVHGALPAGEGNLGLDAQGSIVRMRTVRPDGLGREVAGALFSGIHVLSSAVVDRAPSRGCLVADVYLPMLAEGARLRAVPTSGRWHDVGDLVSYLTANLDLLEGAPALIASHAEIAEGVELDRCVIGAGARITGRGVLREVVIWPGARVTAPCQRIVALEEGSTIAIAMSRGR